MTDFTLEKNELNPTIKFIVIAVSSTLLTMILIMGGCTAHSNTYDAERIQSETELQRVKMEASKAEAEANQAIRIAESNTKKETILAIERLIEGGTNPIAARCAISGWSTKSRDTTCELAINVPSSTNKNLLND